MKLKLISRNANKATELKLARAVQNGIVTKAEAKAASKRLKAQISNAEADARAKEIEAAKLEAARVENVRLDKAARAAHKRIVRTELKEGMDALEAIVSPPVTPNDTAESLTNRLAVIAPVAAPNGATELVNPELFHIRLVKGRRGDVLTLVKDIDDSRARLNAISKGEGVLQKVDGGKKSGRFVWNGHHVPETLAPEWQLIRAAAALAKAHDEYSRAVMDRETGKAKA